MRGFIKNFTINSFFFIALFTAFTIPRCGVYWNRVPFTLANLLGGIVFLAWGICLIVFRKKIDVGGALGKIAVVFLIYAFIWMIVGVFTGEVFGAVVNFLIIAGGVPFFFMTLDLIRPPKDSRIFLNLVCLSLLVVCSYGLLQVFGDIEAISLSGFTELYGSPKDPEITIVHGNPQTIAGPAWQKNAIWSWESDIPIFVGTKIFSTFHHGNLFGSHLATFLPLVIAMASVKKKRIAVVLLALLSILGGINLFFTNSRAALLGLLIGLIVMVALRKKSFLVIASLGLITILLFLSIFAWAIFHQHNLTGVDPSIYLSYYEYRYTPSYYKYRYLDLVGLPDRERWGVIDELSNQRISALKKALETVSHPSTIWGGLFGRTFEFEPDQILYNFFMKLIYTMGLVGFGLFSGLLIILFVTILKSIPHLKSISDSIIVIGGMAGLLAGLIHNLLDSPFCYPPLAINFWILSGFVVSKAHSYK